MTRHLLRFLLFAVAAFVARPDIAFPQPAPDSYHAVPAFPNLTFERPVDLKWPGDGSGRLFVVEQSGTIRVFDNDPGATDAELFLDIRDRVSDEGMEMGLLGLAFDPRFTDNANFFVYYTANRPRRRVGNITRFTVAADNPSRGDADSERLVLQVREPWSNHNGGCLVFGPDKMLYLGLGDGGSGGDPLGNGQNRETLLGSIIRIDASVYPYAIPPSNPFAGNQDGWREEIYAYGLRNPWRFSFDPATGELWAADVGQVTWEEVDVIQSGGNYGWDCREGFEPYEPANERSPACGEGPYTAPVYAYGRKEGVSVTGGYVYRGRLHPDLVGWYIYGDYGSGRIWALRRGEKGVENIQIADTDLFISSFGVDEAGELLILNHNAGGGATQIYRLEPVRGGE